MKKADKSSFAGTKVDSEQVFKTRRSAKPIAKPDVVCSAFNTRNKIPIKDADDFNDVASDIFTNFLEGFTIENGLIRPVTDDDEVEEYISFMYTNKGTQLAERMLNRLSNLGARYFDEFDIEIKSSLYVED